MARTYVLDANAALDFFEGGPGTTRLKQLFLEAANQSAALFISVANLGEVFYHIFQEHGEEAARKAVSELLLLSVRPVDVDIELALKAGMIKARHKIPYVDCLAAALATLRQAVLVTGDRDFEKLGRHADILWIHRN